MNLWLSVESSIVLGARVLDAESDIITFHIGSGAILGLL
jgi:hypothetical protein